MAFMQTLKKKSKFIEVTNKIIQFIIKNSHSPIRLEWSQNSALLLKEVLRAIMGIIDLSEPYASTRKNS